MPLTTRPRSAVLLSSSAAFFLAFAVACAEDPGPVVDVDPDAGTPGDPDGGELVAGEDLCGDGLDQDLDGEADDECNVVFVTSTPVELSAIVEGGDVLAGADAHCNALAAEAGLDGSFVAYLSTKQVNAISRIESARGFVRVDGRPIADTAAEFAVGNFRYPIALTEHGDAVHVEVATGTKPGGSSDYEAICANFTNLSSGSIASGFSDAGTYRFASDGTRTCTETHRLYCVGIEHATPLAPTSLPEPPYHRAFLSNLALAPGSGVVGADGICAAEALAAGLEGEFVALLPVDGSPASSRIVADGRPIVRPDGVVIAESPAAFGAGEWLAPISMLASGFPATTTVWVAAPSPSEAGIGSCGGFTELDPGADALTWEGYLPWNSPATLPKPCNHDAASVYCVAR